jgi:uncharacterized lipoprotein YbaY
MSLALLASVVFSTPVSSVEYISGTVAYRERIALSGRTELVVDLDRFTKDGTQTNLSRVRLQLGTKQVPIPFVIPYLPESIKAGDTYGVRAEIFVNGTLRWQSDAHSMVIANKKTNANLTVNRVPADAYTTILNREWTLVWLEGKSVPATSKITLNLQGKDQLTARSGVNSIRGTFAYAAPTIQLDPGPMTLMAGSPEAMERERRYVQVLFQTNRATLEEGQLVLSRGENTLAIFRPTKR